MKKDWWKYIWSLFLCPSLVVIFSFVLSSYVVIEKDVNRVKITTFHTRCEVVQGLVSDIWTDFVKYQQHNDELSCSNKVSFEEGGSIQR